MNVTYLVADNAENWNSAEWRCAMPARALNRSGRHAARMARLDDWQKGLCDADAEWADVLVIQRNLFGPALPLMVHWKARGKRVFVDLDDAYAIIRPSYNVTAHNASYSFWRGLATPGFNPLEHLKYGLKLVDGITTPSPVIARDLAEYGRTIVLPNYPETAPYLAAPKVEHDGIRIGWAGGGSHLESFTQTGILPALERVAAARPQVEIVIIGDASILQRVRAQRKLFIPWGEYRDYPSKLRALDIGLAPLAGGYDRRRSWIKGLEYSLMGIPWLATDYQSHPQPYEAFGSVQLVKNQANSWERRLLDTIDCPGAWDQKVRENYEFACAQDIDLNVEKIVEAYQ